MSVSLKHKFHSSIPDAPDTGWVRPTNWNDEHNLTGTANAVLAFDASGNYKASAVSVNSHDTLVPAASTTGGASLNVPSGTAPSSPNNGDVWFDGNGFNVRIGGVTRTFALIGPLLTLISAAGSYSLSATSQGYRIQAISGNVTINVGTCAGRNSLPFTVAIDGFDPVNNTLTVNFQTGEGPRGSDTYTFESPYQVSTFYPTENNAHFYIG